MTTPLSQPDPANDAAAEPAPSGARLPLWRCKAPQDHEVELVARGIIPDRIEEELRLVDANHPVHDQFRKVLKEILAPYVPASELARLDTVTLRLADMKGGFGFCISALDPSFAKSPKTIDALIGLLVHEFAHVLFEAEYEVCRGKQEEAAADIVAVRRLHEWGLDPRAYLDLMKGLYDPNTSEPRWRRGHLQELIDVHPMTATRIGYISAEITRLEQEYGELRVEPKPISEPNPFQSVLREMRHCSAYVRATAADRLEACVSFIRGTEAWNKARFQDMAQELSALQPAFRSEDKRLHSAIDLCADVLLDRIGTFGERLSATVYQNDWVAQERQRESRQWCLWLVDLYQQLCLDSEAIWQSPLRGRLKPLGRAAAAAVAEGDVAARCDALEQCTTLIEADGLLSSTPVGMLLKQLSWPAFGIPEKVGERVPWEEPLQEAIRRQSDDALLGLLYLGVEDRRITQALSSEGVLRYLSRSISLPTDSGHVHGLAWGVTARTRSVSYDVVDQRGEKFVRKDHFSGAHLVLSPDGYVLTLPTTIEEHYSVPRSYNEAVERSLYRPNLLEVLDTRSTLGQEKRASLERLCATLESRYGEKRELGPVTELLANPARYLARYSELLKDHSAQRQILSSLERYISEHPDPAALSKVREILETLLPSELAIKIGRSTIDLAVANEEQVVRVEALAPTTLFPFVEQVGLYSRREKLVRLGAEIGYLPMKSELLRYRPVAQLLFPDLSIPARSWDELVKNVAAIKEELTRELVTEEMSEARHSLCLVATVASDARA